MVIVFITVIGCYLAAAGLVHVVHGCLNRSSERKKMGGRHYVWIADQGQSDIEWHLRSLFSFSRTSGKDVQLTVVDNGLSEEELAIVNRFSREEEKIKIHPVYDRVGKKKASISEKTASKEKVADREKGRSKEGVPSSEEAPLNCRNAEQWIWMLQNEGVVRGSDSAVFIDLHNPADLSKLPY